MPSVSLRSTWERNMNGEVEILAPVRNDELAELEERIERAQRNAYYEIGLALSRIHGRQLYKEEFSTFEEYCQERWEWGRSRGYRLMEAALAAEKMLPIGNILPTRESHVRPLLIKDKDGKDILTDDEKAEAWSQALDDANQENRKVQAKDVEAAVARIKAAKEKDWITLEDWNKLTPQEQGRALKIIPNDKKFNSQDNTSIEWAKWSWNPITGCRHDCPYCYARDIAERFYPQKFEPSVVPSRFHAPAKTEIPARASGDISYKNVFTCSMADLFGRWVPDEWINSVFGIIKANPQWNFLFLTKFPQRMAEFEWPENAWPGTSVDLQIRAKNAEKAFRKVSGGKKWLSIEPMIEPIDIDLSIFDWIVIGGASKSTQTPEWKPPRRWVIDLTQRAIDAGCAVYHKDNLNLERLREYPGMIADAEIIRAPDAFHYLGKAKSDDQRAEAI